MRRQETGSLTPLPVLENYQTQWREALRLMAGVPEDEMAAMLTAAQTQLDTQQQLLALAGSARAAQMARAMRRAKRSSP